MTKYLWLICIVMFVSCSPEKGNVEEAVYMDILPELVYKESYFGVKDIPPPPSPKRNKGESGEVYELRVEVNELEEKIRFLLDESNKPKEIHLLKSLLILAPDSFKAAGIFVGRNYYDSTWIGKTLTNRPETSESLNQALTGFRAGIYDIRLVNTVPEPYAEKEKEHLRLYYLQLSQIAFDEPKTKGVFYYAVASDANANGVGGYAYIVKENSKWTIKKIEE